MKPPRTTTLPNGIHAAVQSVPGARTVAVEVRVGRCGPAYEPPELGGVSHFLEHMIARGSVRHPGAAAIGGALDDLGMAVDFATDVEGMTLSMRVLPDRFAEAAALLAQMIREPAFADLESERAIVLDEAERDDWVDGELLVDHETRLMAELFDGAIGLPIVGSPATVRAIGVEHLRAHHAKHLTGSNMVVAVAGAVDADAALETVGRVFCSIPAGRRVPVQDVEVSAWDSPAVVWLPDGEERARITIGLSVERFAPRMQAAVEMLLAILDRGESSRLPQLRARSALSYDLHASLSTFERCGLLLIETNSRQPMRSVQEILALLGDLVARGVSAAELERARRLVRLDTAEDETPAEVAAEIADAMAVGDAITTADERTALQLAVSVREVNGVARRIIRPEGLAVVISGDLLAMERAEIEREVGNWRPATAELVVDVDALVVGRFPWQREPRAVAE